MQDWIGIGAAALLGLASLSAAASDGRLEINQSCVATGCFPGDAAGFPVETQEATSYVLTSNLVVPNADTIAVTLGASATLDLNGFAISGTTSCTGTPVTSCTPTGSGIGVYAEHFATIRNGTIRKMGSYGVGGNGGIRIESMLIEENGSYGLFFNFSNEGPDANVIRDSHVSRNGAAGVQESGGGGGIGTLITGSVFYGNKNAGVQGFNVHVTNNTFARNGNVGISGSTAAVGGNTFLFNNGGNDQPQTGPIVSISPNFCGTDTTCP